MADLLSKLLDPSRIALSVQSSDRITAITEVARLLERHPDVTDYQGFYDELLTREQLETTCLGNELAIPHSRTEHVKDIVLAVGRSTDGVVFENANQKVRLLFVLGTPKACPTEYLVLVRTLCKILKNSATRETLMKVSSPDTFVAALIDAEGKLAVPNVIQ